jgi:hypothetical protein
MNVAVDQAGRDRGAIGIDDGGGAFGIYILGAADSRDLAVFRDNRVGIEDRLFHGAREQQADIADYQFAATGCLRFIVGHGLVPLLFNAVAGSNPNLSAAWRPDQVGLFIRMQINRALQFPAAAACALR